MIEQFSDLKAGGSKEISESILDLFMTDSVQNNLLKQSSAAGESNLAVSAALLLEGSKIQAEFGNLMLTADSTPPDDFRYPGPAPSYPRGPFPPQDS